MDILSKAKSTVARYSMLLPGDRVVVAVSGGPDSIALLDLLYHLREEMDLTLVVAHYHHQLRGRAADKDQALVEGAAKKYMLEFIADKAPEGWWKKLKGSNEELARKMRYEFLENTAARIAGQRIALGHNANDLAESFFINLLRGSGMLGLAGMPPVRGKIIRPLIEIGREEILYYLHEHSLAFRMDKTNKDKRILRNRIRSDLTPMLKTYNPEIIAAIGRAGEVLREDERLLQTLALGAYANLARVEPGRVVFSVNKFLAEHKSIRRRLIRQAIEHLKTDLRKISAVHVFDLERMLNSGAAGFELDLPGNLRIRKSYDRLSVEVAVLKEEPAFEPVPLRVPCREKIVVSSEFEIEFTSGHAEFSEFQQSLGQRPERKNVFVSGEDRDWTALNGLEPLEIRRPRPGDRIQPLGMKGRRKLKEIFSELKVPREQRAFYPVLASPTELIWVPGFGISEKAKVQANSEQIALLKLKVIKRSLPAP